MPAYLLLVSLLLGPSSSYEPINPNNWIEEQTECETTLTNPDSVVFDNVTIAGGLLGFRIEYLFPQCCKQSQTATLVTTQLGYNPFLQTATFNPGALVFKFDTCE